MSASNQDVKTSNGQSWFETLVDLNTEHYPNCVREAGLWGIGTGFFMGVHRMRMGSSARIVINAFAITCFGISGLTYFPCSRKEYYKRQVIEEMMTANEFEHKSKAPIQPGVEDHPFLEKAKKGKLQESGKAYAVYHDVDKYSGKDDNQRTQ